MTAEALIIILGGFFTGVSAMIVAYVNRQNSAIKEQFEALKNLVDVLHKENNELCDEIDALKAENKKQYRQLQSQEDEIADLRRSIAEKDGSLKQVKAWAEMLVKTLKVNGVKDIPAMPEREITKPRPK